MRQVPIIETIPTFPMQAADILYAQEIIMNIYSYLPKWDIYTW